MLFDHFLNHSGYTEDFSTQLRWENVYDTMGAENLALKSWEAGPDCTQKAHIPLIPSSPLQSPIPLAKSPGHPSSQGHASNFSHSLF